MLFLVYRTERNGMALLNTHVFIRAELLQINFLLLRVIHRFEFCVNRVN